MMRGPSLNELLPLDTSHPAARNHRGLRLFAVACAERVLSLLTDPHVRGAIDAARSYAAGELSWEALEFAYVMADAIQVPSRMRLPHHWATIAATACASIECTASQFVLGRSPEWAAIAAARIASCAAQLAEQGAYYRTTWEIEREQLALLRQHVPECFDDDIFSEIGVIAHASD
jgi:hypothetical protein